MTEKLRDSWLIRAGSKNEYRVLGPMSRDGVLDLIRRGSVDLADEVCGANQYWFAFHESDELHRHLGVSWSQLRKDSAESTRVDGTSDQEEETDEITESSIGRNRTSGRARPRSVHLPSGSLPSRSVEEESGLSDFFSKVPLLFWVFFSCFIFSFLYGFFGSRK